MLPFNDSSIPPSADVPASAAARALFSGSGEMSARCLAFDWAAGPLGPVEGWSQSLRTTVGLVLGCRNPMFLWWGPERIQFYNDAYRPSLGEGGRHPQALGARARAFWTDIWATIGPQIDGVMTTGEAIWHEDLFLPIERNGRLDDAWWTYSYSPVRDDDGSIGGTLVVTQETTSRVLAERQTQQLVASLEAEHARLAAIFEHAPTFLAVLRGPRHVFELVNPAYRRLIGHRDVVGKPVLEALPELNEQGFSELLDRVRATGEPYIGTQIPIQLAHVPGAPLERRYLDFVYQRVEEAGGEPLVVAHGMDVTEHVLATEALRRSKERLSEQFAKLPVPTYLWEARGDDFVLLDWNEAAVVANPLLGPDAVGRTTQEAVPDVVDVRLDLRRCLDENRVLRRQSRVDTGAPHGLRVLDLTIGPQQPDRVLVHAVDVTEKAQLEEQLRQSQKMEAVGRLAGGIAHDFNNLLTVVGAHSSFLRESLAPADPLREDARAISEATLQAAALTRQLLAFGRKEVVKPTRLALNPIVEDTRKLLARVLGEDVELVTRLAADLGVVIADRSQLDQVLMNLAVNARDAMPDGGRLTMTTRNVTIAGGPEGTPGLLAAGDYALLEVADTGIGMDAATQARAFEPFFTTKGPHQGSGLGLATVYGIVQQSGGHILVESEPGRGSTFRIYLPVVAAEAVAEERPKAELAAAPGLETVLVVEDERLVREIARRVLARQGYVVLEAASGLEALALSAAFAGTIHLVLSDAVMPGMGGAEAVRRLQEQRPGLKAVLMSGYINDEVVRRGLGASDMPFLQKPFAPIDLACAVRDALDRG